MKITPYTDEQINKVLDQKPNVIDTITFDRTRFELYFIEQGKRDEKRDLSIPYKSLNGALVKFREDGSGYGVNIFGAWFDNSYWVDFTQRKSDGSYYWQPATSREWVDMLCKQEEKRGHKQVFYGATGKWSEIIEQTTDMKSKLKDGYTVVYRDGTDRTVKGGDLYFNGGLANLLTCYNDDLRQTSPLIKDNDIVSIRNANNIEIWKRDKDDNWVDIEHSGDRKTVTISEAVQMIADKLEMNIKVE